MSALNADRALEAYRRYLELDQAFRTLMTQAVTARGSSLDRVESQMEALHPQLRRAQDDLARALLTIKQSYEDRVSVPVSLQQNGDLFSGTLNLGSSGSGAVTGASAEEVVRRLQELVDQG